MKFLHKIIIIIRHATTRTTSRVEEEEKQKNKLVSCIPIAFKTKGERKRGGDCVCLLVG